MECVKLQECRIYEHKMSLSSYMYKYRNVGCVVVGPGDDVSSSLSNIELSRMF